MTGTKTAPAGNFFVWFGQNSGGNTGTFPTAFSSAYRTADNGDVQAVKTIDCAGPSLNDQLDIIVGTKSPTAGQGTFEIWQSNNAATPTFTRLETYPTAGGIPGNSLGEVNALALADVNGDGKKDLIVGTRTGSYTGQLMIFRNNGKSAGTSRFTFAQSVPVAGVVTCIAPTRVDADTLTDLIIGVQTGFGAGELQEIHNATIAGIINFLYSRKYNAPGIPLSLDRSGPGRHRRQDDIAMGWRQNETSFVGGIRVLSSISTALPAAIDTDPSNGSVTNMVPALTSNNFNYGVQPTTPLPPLPARRRGRRQGQRDHRRAGGVHPMSEPVKVPPPGRDERGIALVMALMVLLAMSLLAVLLMISLQVEEQDRRPQRALLRGPQHRRGRRRRGTVAHPQQRLSQQHEPAHRGSGVPGAVRQRSGMRARHLPRRYRTAGWPVAQLQHRQQGHQRAHRQVQDRPDRHRDLPLRPQHQSADQSQHRLPNLGGHRTRPERRRRAPHSHRGDPETFQHRDSGAMSSKMGIDFSGNAQVCGYNHRLDTPSFTNGVHGAGPCQVWEIAGGDLPGSWSEQSVTSGGSAAESGNPVNNRDAQGTGFYSGPWDALGLTEAEFFSWVGTPLAVPPATPVGIYYLDNNFVHQDQSGVFAYNGSNGEGFLYIDGDMTLNGNFTFRGMIYIEGDLKVNGNVWILGALVVKGKSRIKIANGSCVVLYSRDAVQQNIAKYGGQFTTLSWSELPIGP